MPATSPIETLPDLSQSHASPELAGIQRALVDAQLADMRQGKVARHFAAAAEIFKTIPEPDDGRTLSLLDVGCGSAYYSEVLSYLTGRTFDYTGADYNDGMLALARQRYPHLTLVTTDVRKLVFDARSFDVVLSGACLVHVKEWQAGLAELVRVSKRWIILHRTLVRYNPPTEIRVEHLYGRDMYRVYIHPRELFDAAGSLGCIVRATVDCGEGYDGENVGNHTYLLEREDHA